MYEYCGRAALLVVFAFEKATKRGVKKEARKISSFGSHSTPYLLSRAPPPRARRRRLRRQLQLSIRVITTIIFECHSVICSDDGKTKRFAKTSRFANHHRLILVHVRLLKDLQELSACHTNPMREPIREPSGETALRLTPPLELPHKTKHRSSQINRHIKQNHRRIENPLIILTDTNSKKESSL